MTERRAGTRAFGYDAAVAGKRRKPPESRITSEDAGLTKRQRDALANGGQDVVRNFAIAAWGVRTHLDYVTEFDLHTRTGDDAFDDAFELLVKDWMTADLFDVSGRHPGDRYLRLMEARKVIDGDIANVFLQTGHVQAIEGDRVCNPPESDEGWTHGVKTLATGRASAYYVRDRGPKGKGYTGGRQIDANNLYLHAHYDRFDQYRGVGPIASGLNSLRDIYEGFDYGIAKLKIEQLFCMAITRNAQAMLDGAVEDGETTEGKKKYSIDFGKGPVLLDLDPGEDASFLKSDSPGGNSREFLWAICMVALKALDIPFSFFDESFTNFYGSVAAWRHYDRKCRAKRRDIKAFLDWWLTKRTALAVARRELKIPRKFSLARPWWEWCPSGMPWWDPSKEINADLLAVQAGWGTPQKICKQRGGGDWYRNIDEIAKANEYAGQRRVTTSFNPQPAAPPDPIDEAERNAQ